MAKYANREMALSVLAAGRDTSEEEGVLAVQLAQVYAILDLADAVREVALCPKHEWIKHSGPDGVYTYCRLCEMRKP